MEDQNKNNCQKAKDIFERAIAGYKDVEKKWEAIMQEPSLFYTQCRKLNDDILALAFIVDRFEIIPRRIFAQEFGACEISDFYGDFARIRKQNEEGSFISNVINKQGKLLLKEWRDFVEFRVCGPKCLIKSEFDNEYADIYNSDGELLEADVCILKKINREDPKTFCIIKEHSYSVYDENGEDLFSHEILDMKSLLRYFNAISFENDKYKIYNRSFQLVIDKVFTEKEIQDLKQDKEANYPKSQLLRLNGGVNVQAHNYISSEREGYLFENDIDVSFSSPCGYIMAFINDSYDIFNAKGESLIQEKGYFLPQGQEFTFKEYFEDINIVALEYSEGTKFYNVKLGEFIINESYDCSDYKSVSGGNGLFVKLKDKTNFVLTLDGRKIFENTDVDKHKIQYYFEHDVFLQYTFDDIFQDITIKNADGLNYFQKDESLSNNSFFSNDQPFAYGYEVVKTYIDHIPQYTLMDAQNNRLPSLEKDGFEYFDSITFDENIECFQVKRGSVINYIDKEGNYLFNEWQDFYSISEFRDGHAIARVINRQEDYFCIVDKNLTVIFDNKKDETSTEGLYHEITFPKQRHKDIFMVVSWQQEDGQVKKGYLDYNCNRIENAVFDNIEHDPSDDLPFGVVRLDDEFYLYSIKTGIIKEKSGERFSLGANNEICTFQKGDKFITYDLLLGEVLYEQFT